MNLNSHNILILSSIYQTSKLNSFSFLTWKLCARTIGWRFIMSTFLGFSIDIFSTKRRSWAEEAEDSYLYPEEDINYIHRHEWLVCIQPFPAQFSFIFELCISSDKRWKSSLSKGIIMTTLYSIVEKREEEPSTYSTCESVRMICVTPKRKWKKSA
jgi:hypothetical protein